MSKKEDAVYDIADGTNFISSKAGDDGSLVRAKIINALKLTVEKYKKGIFTTSIKDCYFCQAVGKRDYEHSCGVCPMFGDSGLNGCSEFNSYEILRNIVEIKKGKGSRPTYGGGSDVIKSPETTKAFKNRIKFHEKYLLPLIESLPPERFTESGFRFIEHDWDRL